MIKLPTFKSTGNRARCPYLLTARQVDSLRRVVLSLLGGCCLLLSSVRLGVSCSCLQNDGLAPSAPTAGHPDQLDLAIRSELRL